MAFDGVTVAYKGNTVLDSFTLDVRPGEIVALLGPSGSGKTTALRAMAGFVRPVRGRLRIGERDVTDLPPSARNIGMVVQSYALFPHMRAEENVAFGLRARGAPEATVRERVRDCLRLVGMEGFAERFPRELSGGQQQRVGIARAIAIRPQVLLLDEPLSALDAQIRRSMLDELAKLHRELPDLTALYVTHDQNEALSLADRIAILRDGRLAAFGPSRELYRTPPNRFTAEFLGRANLLPATVETTDAGSGLARVRFGASSLRARANPTLRDGQPCLLCVRPHELVLAPAAGENAIPGTVRAARWLGELHHVTLEADGGHTLDVSSTLLRHPPEPGAPIEARFASEDASLILPETRDGGG